MRLLIAFMLCLASAAAGAADAPALYAEHCAECHGLERLGGMGPALLPGNLGRLKREAGAGVIRDGRVSTQMPGFAEQLDDAAIEALVGLIFTPPATPPVWGVAEIVASRIVHVADVPVEATPEFDADPLNLFVVVEMGDHHVSLLDGDSFEVIARFPSRYALHGGAKFSPDGRFVYFGSRDGWISKYDIYRLELVAEIRAGINTRNIAISADGRVVAVANYLPNTLVMLDSDLNLLQVKSVLGEIDKTPSRVSAVYQAAPRESFVVALKDIPEMWEVAYAEDAPPVLGDFVHSHEKGMVEGLAADDGAFPVRRVPLTAPLDDFFFDPTYRLVMGSARGAGKAVVVHLDVRREIAEIAMPGLPHLGSGISWMRNGTRVMATPHLGQGRISVIDMEDWSEIATIETLGPGFFMRSHENTPYAWADVFFGPNKDAIHVIDKQSLEIVATLRPEPGKTAAHIEFTRDGSHALVSLWEHDGAIVVYDAKTLEEVTRIPFVKPSGKYNVYNKITLSEGTSH
jgi:DNA-binding beta-propeller fold protein YncE